MTSVLLRGRRPLFPMVFIRRHLPQKTNGPAVWQRTRTCVNGLEERGCPRSLFTIYLRWSSCRLLMDSLSLIQCSLSLPVLWSCNLSGQIHVGHVCLHVFQLWVFCVRPDLCQCPPSAYKAQRCVFRFTNPVDSYLTMKVLDYDIQYKCCFVRTKQEI